MLMMRKCLFFVLLLFISTVAGAVPAKRGQWTTLTLADGQQVKATLMGDEHLHYWQDERGRSYVFDKSSRRYVNADMAALEAKAGVRRTKAASRRHHRMARRRIGDYGNYTGAKKGLIILVEYTDVKFEEGHTLELYKRIANEEHFSNDLGFEGSVHDYFSDQSQGQFDLTFDIYGPITLAHERSYYGENDSQGNDTNPEQMVVEACTALKDEVDFSRYDWDDDGEVDQVFILYAGKGEANGGSRDTVWPHEWTLDEAGQELVIDGCRINTYGCSCELQRFGIDGIGTICHEFSHCLGFPDMYDITYHGNYGMDCWDLMDHGSYNGNGFIPAGYTSYEKMAAGWLAPIELKGTMGVNGLKALSEGGSSYIIYNKGHQDEYYLVENRQPTLWDRAIGASGLLVLHVDYKPELWAANIVNSTGSFGDEYGFNPPVYNNHELCTVFHAGNSDNKNVITDAYPCNGNDSLTNHSKPVAKVYNKNTDGTYYMNIRLTNISITDGKASFRFTDNVPSVIDEQPEITDTLFYESFNQCDGKGGNDGLWSGNIATGNFTPDNTWTENKAYGANQCARVGNTSSAGYLITPEIDIRGTAIVTFLAAPWNVDNNFMFVMPYDGYDAMVSESVFALMTPKQWTEHQLTVTANGPIKLLFYSNKNRFFIDEIVVVGPGAPGGGDPGDDPDKPQPQDGFLSIGMATLTDGCLSETFLDSFGRPFNPVTYQVEIQENIQTPGLFRLVNPYGEAYPYYEEGKYDKESDWYVEIHAEDPQAVYIDRQPTGWTDGQPFFIQSVGSYRMEHGDDLQTLVDNGMMGTLLHGVITFPKQGIYIFPGEDASPQTVNASGNTRIVLPEGSQEPTAIEKCGGLFHNPLATWTDNPPMQVYDLQGRRISYPSAPAPHSSKKGIYIVRQDSDSPHGRNGVKILVR